MNRGRRPRACESAQADAESFDEERQGRVLLNRHGHRHRPASKLGRPSGRVALPSPPPFGTRGALGTGRSAAVTVKAAGGCDCEGGRLMGGAPPRTIGERPRDGVNAAGVNAAGVSAAASQ